ncbi:hypothetical protein GFS60_03647 [Rhodococcus sp. WAY2]|nr:hypothetical protein GFS60_03647 [Rhodococcus sp. WAY2]
MLHALVACFLFLTGRWLSAPIRNPITALAQARTVMRWVDLTSSCSNTPVDSPDH